jgi:hypothetical protein
VQGGEDIKEDGDEHAAAEHACGDARDQAGQSRALTRVVQPHRGHADEQHAREHQAARQHRPEHLLCQSPRIEAQGGRGIRGQKEQHAFDDREQRQVQVPVMLENSNRHATLCLVRLLAES